MVVAVAEFPEQASAFVAVVAVAEFPEQASAFVAVVAVAEFPEHELAVLAEEAFPLSVPLKVVADTLEAFVMPLSCFVLHLFHSWSKSFTASVTSEILCFTIYYL